MSLFSEFKEFATRGNVMDLAIAVVIGGAFGKIVSALVDGIIMPVIGLVLGGIHVSGKQSTVGHAVIKWGEFLQAVIDFTLIAFSIFLVIKFLNKLHIQPIQKPTIPEDVKLLTEIRDLLKKRAHSDS